MKHAAFAFLFTALLLPASAEDTSYRATLDAVRERYHALDAERNDYRKSKPGLPPAQEEEYLRLSGQLANNDPMWALTRNLQADLDALVAIRSRTPAESAILEDIKDFLAITSAFQDRANTLLEAEAFATAFRQFIVRRDVHGARNWANSK